MDSNNLYNIQRIVGIDKDKKINLFLDYAGMHRDISDPWYTGDFDKTEDDIIIGIKAFYNYLFVNKKIL